MRTKDDLDDILAEKLTDPGFAAAYLSESLTDAVRSERMDIFVTALREVVDAHGGPALLAQIVNRSRQHIYKLLSEGDEGFNPTLNTLVSLVQALGLSVSFAPQEVREPEEGEQVAG
jgi:DNA-binding phage protein